MAKTPPSTETKGGGKSAPQSSGPWAPLTSLRSEIDRLFDDFDPTRWTVPGAMRLMADIPPVPAMDLVESDGHYTVTAEIPGMAPEDIDIKVADDTLTIRGEKREETERSEDDRIVSERRYGSFQRVMRLPGDVDAEKIAATCAKGVLTLTLPKSPDAKAREKKIEVKAG